MTVLLRILSLKSTGELRILLRILSSNNQESLIKLNILVFEPFTMVQPR